MTPEGKVKSQVDVLLKEMAAYYLKPVQNGMGAPALDYHGVHRGLAFVIETKAKGKRPSPRQVNTIRRIAAAGGSCFVIDDISGADYAELHNWLHFPLSDFLSTSAKSCLVPTDSTCHRNSETL